ncbi:hypothetical protein [Rhodococcus pyridinivorans]|uniref:hypothetical protein n=1 Tax=Rhodococcus pyridinivorans TaxID=103816 RepID=UPI003AAF4ED5
MPNLVWLPSWLAPLSDRQGSPVQAILQRTSIKTFRDVSLSPSLKTFAERAWGKLPLPSAGPALPVHQLAFFEPDDKFFDRRIAYLDKVIAGCASVLHTGTLSSKLICSRYTVGLPLLEPSSARTFHDAIASYRTALTAGQLLRVTPL